MKNNKKYSIVIFLLFALGITIRIFAACKWVHYHDLGNYNIPWALGMAEYKLDAYRQMWLLLDYPPLFPSLLWLISPAVKLAQESGAVRALMFWIKLWPMVFDLMLSTYLCFLGRRKSNDFSIFIALIWLLNPAALINCAIWGQTDMMMLLFVALCATAFWDEKPVWATVWFAVGCLTKLQMAYFAPLLLLELFFKYKPKRAVTSLAIGGTVGLLGWLPFMLGSMMYIIPFKIYLGGFNKYGVINSYAYNIYGFKDLNGVPDSELFLGIISFSRLNAIINILILAFTVFAFIYARKHNKNVPFWEHSIFWMNALYILSTKMRERYQLPVLCLCIIGYVLTCEKKWIFASIALIIITTINQFILFQCMTAGLDMAVFNASQPIGSAVNILLFIWLTLVYLKDVFGKETTIVVNQ